MVRENICGQQYIGCSMRSRPVPNSTPSTHRQTEENPCAAGNPVSAMQKAENNCRGQKCKPRNAPERNRLEILRNQAAHEKAPECQLLRERDGNDGGQHSEGDPVTRAPRRKPSKRLKLHDRRLGLKIDLTRPTSRKQWRRLLERASRTSNSDSRNCAGKPKACRVPRRTAEDTAIQGCPHLWPLHRSFRRRVSSQTAAKRQQWYYALLY
jgi:hypothetical protein